MEKTGDRFLHQVEEIIVIDEEGGRAPREILDRVVGLLARSYPSFDWVGIYILQGEELVLGPFRGPQTVHTRIPVGQGICGAAAQAGETIIVDDVGRDERYLACFPTTRSEIVVPIPASEGVIGEIDIDSDHPAAFGPQDQALLEALASRLAPLVEALRSGGEQSTLLS